MNHSGRSWMPALSILLCFALVLTGCSSKSNDSQADSAPIQASLEESRDKAASSQAKARSEAASKARAQSESEAAAKASSQAAASRAQADQANPAASSISLDQIPPYSGQPYTVINGNNPFFDPNELTADSFQHYFDLDSLGRATLAYGSIGQDIMPTGKRGDISSVHPSGWHQHEYSFIKDGQMVYNRSHLIAYSLAGQNANPKNLITGTRYFNATGMEPFESQVRDYVKETGNHVMYRVTPMYSGNDLVARGVLMEAESVEDKGEGIKFCVFVYNVQPGVSIDYATGYTQADGTQGDGGSNTAASTAPAAPAAPAPAQPDEPSSFTPAPDAAPVPSQNAGQVESYVLNTHTKKFHRPDCASVEEMSPANRQDVQNTRQDLISQGYSPCKRCNP